MTKEEILKYPVEAPRGIFHFPQGVFCLTKQEDTGKEEVKIKRILGDEFEFEIIPKKLNKAEQQDFPIRICEYKEQTEEELLNKEEPEIIIKSEKKVDITVSPKQIIKIADGELLKIGNTITYDAGTNLITLDDSAGAGDAWATAYDMEDVLTNCGAVVTKQGANAYDVSARMQFNAGVYFVSINEFVELKPNPINPAWTIRGEIGSHIRIGNYDATDKFSYNGAFWRVYVASTTQAAGNYFKGETLIYGSNFWNDALNYQKAISCEPSGTTKIYNSIIQGISYMRTTDIDMQDVKWMYNAGASHGLMVASGYDYAWSGITTMDASAGAGGFFMSGTTTSAVDMYAVKFLGCIRDVNLSGGCNWLLRLINSPTFSTINTPGSGKPGAKICYTFNVKVVNTAGAGIVGAVVRLKDVDGLTVFEESTVSGGVLATDEIVTKYWYRHTDDGGNKDFNNHTLRVTNGADVVEYVITIDHEIKEDIVLIPTPTASYDDLMTGLTDIKGTSFVKDTHSLVDIQPAVAWNKKVIGWLRSLL